MLINRFFWRRAAWGPERQVIGTSRYDQHVFNPQSWSGISRPARQAKGMITARELNTPSLRYAPCTEAHVTGGISLQPTPRRTRISARFRVGDLARRSGSIRCGLYIKERPGYKDSASCARRAVVYPVIEVKNAPARPRECIATGTPNVMGCVEGFWPPSPRGLARELHHAVEAYYDNLPRKRCTQVGNAAPSAGRRIGSTAAREGICSQTDCWRTGRNTVVM